MKTEIKTLTTLMVLFFACVIVHEILGHALIAFLLGYSPHIEFMTEYLLMGGLSVDIGNTVNEYWHGIVIGFAGGFIAGIVFSPLLRNRSIYGIVPLSSFIFSIFETLSCIARMNGFPVPQAIFWLDVISTITILPVIGIWVMLSDYGGSSNEA